MLERMDGWTGKFQRREDGQFIHKRFKPFLPWSLTGADLDLMRALKRTARKLGVRFIDKTSLTDLLTDGGRVAGAVGFSLLDGSPIVVKAPAAIIATGGQSYRIMGMWSCQRGDGLGMAWRAGAQMRNAEWGPFAQLAGKRGKEPLIGAEDALYNAWHEKLSPTVPRRVRGRRLRHDQRCLVPADDGRQRPAGDVPPRELDARQHHRGRGGRHRVGPPGGREVLDRR